MKLYYYNGKEKSFQVGNFGDDLNPWIWNQLIPNAFDNDESTLFVGIGTLLNEHLPKNSQKIVFGSGVGYGKTPTIDETWKVYFVRGQLSAKALGLEAEKGLTDPAILVRQYYATSGAKRYKRSYMPHFSEVIANGYAWKELCESLNIHYIDPTAPLQQVLQEIEESEVLFSEAMHGAIVADALRTPWVAVKSKKDILDFKWNDWLSNLEIAYQPFFIRRAASIIGKKSFLRRCDYHSIQAQMALMLQIAKPTLSHLEKCEELEEKVMLKVDALKADYFNLL
ncbi:succinoglycan biosynthesis ketolase [filamentous cyanobacterium CCP2]|nr:succinoglycan biosynthesis ketolase [filamentous cyanobacterium CCP2]